MWLMMLRLHVGGARSECGMGKQAGTGRTARLEIGFARPHNAERAGKIARIGGQQQKYGPGNDRRVSVV